MIYRLFNPFSRSNPTGFPTWPSLGYKKPLTLTVLILTLSSSIPVHADDFEREGLRGETYCFPAKYALRMIEALSKVKPDRKDVVDISMDPQFLIYDGGVGPERYFLKSTSGETDFTLKADGRVPDFLSKVGTSNKGDDICIHDPARKGLAEEDESLYFEMGLTPYFKNKSGVHSIDELQEGAKDGKSQYKKMIPSVARMFMPDTRHLHIKYDDFDTQPQIIAKTGRRESPIEGEFYNQGYVIELDALEALDAEALLIKGGAYKLSPVPSIKVMIKYGVGKPRGPQASVTQDDASKFKPGETP